MELIVWGSGFLYDLCGALVSCLAWVGLWVPTLGAGTCILKRSLDACREHLQLSRQLPVLNC